MRKKQNRFDSTRFHHIMKSITFEHKPNSSTKPVIFISAAFGLLFLSLSPTLFGMPSRYAAISIICVNVYLFILLFAAASKSDIKLEKGSAWERFATIIVPDKRLGLAIFSKLLGTFIFGFANLYLGLHNGVKAGNLYLDRFYDSLYFSIVTISTAGYGDFVPVSDQAKALVMWELGSGILLMAGGFGLLISRLSNFK